MKKIRMIVILLLMFIALTGCSNSKEEKMLKKIEDSNYLIVHQFHKTGNYYDKNKKCYDLATNEKLCPNETRDEEVDLIMLINKSNKDRYFTIDKTKKLVYYTQTEGIDYFSYYYDEDLTNVLIMYTNIDNYDNCIYIIKSSDEESNNEGYVTCPKSIEEKADVIIANMKEALKSFDISEKDLFAFGDWYKKEYMVAHKKSLDK